MARLMALALRDRAREAMLAGGGRGFMRFPERGALLVSDAIRRCEGEAAQTRLLDALAQAGFDCREQDALLMITPSDVLLTQIVCGEGCAVDWDGPLCGAQTLARRWLARQKQPLTPAGRQLIIDTLRLTWRGVTAENLASLRAQATVMLRGKDTSGFHEAGAVLENWCDMQEETDHEN